MRFKTFHIIKQRIKEGLPKEIMKQTGWLYFYARKYWLAIIFYTVIGFSGSLISIGSSLISKNLVDIITGHKTGALMQTFAAMIGFAIGSLLITQFSSYISNWINLKIDTEIKADIYEKMLSTDWEHIANYHTGDLLSRWSSDASTISNGILSWLPNLFISLFQFISAFAVMIYYDASFAIFSFIGIPVTLIMSRTLMSRMINNNKRSAAMNAKLQGFNQESFSNIQTIKAFDLIKVYINYLKSLQKEYITMRMDFQKLSIVTSILMSVVGLIVSYSSYGWGIYRVWSGAISYGTMTMFLSLSGSLTGSLNALIGTVPTAINLTTSAGRIVDILDMPKEDYSLDERVKEFYDSHKNEGITLTVKDLGYTYSNGCQVFEDAEIHAAPHEIVALVGPSGEGKTTMLRLLLSLLSPKEGNISLNAGDDCIPLTPSSRKLFSYVPQGNTMFSGTIAENMRNVKQDATDEEIINALKMSCAYDFVKKLPDTINSPLKERGGGLSEGQSQRLSIARALLRKSPILLLDEATSALDVATERRVLKNIMTDDYPRTCIVTTHRPTVLNICDRVYKISDKKCIVMSEDEVTAMIRG